MRTRHILLLLSTIFAGFLSAQSFRIPAYPNPHSNIVPIGTKLSATITNRSDHSVYMYPQLNKPGMENIAVADDSMLAWLNAQIVGLTDLQQIRRRLVKLVVTRVEKTDLYLNNNLAYPIDDDSLTAKFCSITGGLNGVTQKQCSYYVASTMAILVATGYFTYNDIRFVGLKGHTCMEFLLYGYWAFVDCDPAEPFFMISDSTSPNGFASASDIQTHRSLIDESKRYHYVNSNGDSVNLITFASVEIYRNRFDTVYTYVQNHQIQPLAVSGIYSLPPHSALVYDYVTQVYIVDTTDYVNNIAWSSVSYFLQQLTSVEDTADIEAMGDVVSILLGNIAVDSAIDLFLQGRVIAYDPADGVPLFWFVPNVKLVLYPSTDPNDTLFIKNANANNNINFPGYVLGTTTAINFMDTVFNEGTSPMIWAPNFVTGTRPAIDAHQVQYMCNNGYMVRRNQTDTVTLSVGSVWDFKHGFNLQILSGGDSLVAESLYNDSLVFSDSTIVPIIFTHVTETAEGRLNIYPNPNNGVFQLAGAKPGEEIDICNQFGQKVRTITAKGYRQSMDFSSLSCGTYFIKAGDNTLKVICQ